MKKIWLCCLMLILMGYPVWVYFGLSHGEPRYIALAIGFVLLLRLALAKPRLGSVDNSLKIVNLCNKLSNNVGWTERSDVQHSSADELLDITSFSPTYMIDHTQNFTRPKFSHLNCQPPLEHNTKISLYLITTVGLALSVLGAVFNSELIIKLYPVAMNALFFSLFFYSLCYPPTLITRLAQQMEKKPLSPTAIDYTKKVTQCWCVFFVINGLIALWTALYATLSIWTFYNGFIAYVLMGVLFLVEYIVRIFVKRQIAHEVAQ